MDLAKASAFPHTNIGSEARSTFRACSWNVSCKYVHLPLAGLRDDYALAYDAAVGEKALRRAPGEAGRYFIVSTLRCHDR